jgi:hypothetical protein
MTDFFARIAQRTLGTANAVKPLITPRYARESWVAAENLDPGENIEDRPLSSRDNGRVRLVPESRSAVRPSGSSLARQQEVQLEQSERKPWTFDPTDPGPQESRPEPDEGFAGHTHRTQSEKAYPEEPLVPNLPDEGLIIRPNAALKNEKADFRSPDGPEWRTERHDHADSLALPDIKPGPARNEGVLGEPILVPMTPVPAPAETDAGARSDLSQYSAGVSLVPGVDERRETSSPESGSSSESKIVKVSIGRIEVRAVHPPPAPVKRDRPKPQPTLSLDNYLQQRRRGER